MGKSEPEFRHTPATLHGATIRSEVESIDDDFLRAARDLTSISQLAPKG
jgi:hypothetical protein